MKKIARRSMKTRRSLNEYYNSWFISALHNAIVPILSTVTTDSSEVFHSPLSAHHFGQSSKLHLITHQNTSSCKRRKMKDLTNQKTEINHFSSLGETIGRVLRSNWLGRGMRFSSLRPDTVNNVCARNCQNISTNSVVRARLWHPHTHGLLR